MMSNTQYKKLPFAAVGIDALKTFKAFLLPLFLLVIANFSKFTLDVTSSDFWSSLAMIGFWGVILLFSVFFSIIRWWTFHYWFENGELRVKYGLFVKKKRYIPFERIQTLNYHESVLHRLFKLVKVEAETAGSSDGEAEVVLTALTREAANEIEKEMRKAKQQLTDVEQRGVVLETTTPEVTAMYKMSTKDLLILASTSGGIGVLISGIVALLSQLSDIIPYEKIYGELATLAKYGVLMILLAVVVIFAIGWLASVILTYIKYYSFKVVVQEENLIITRGLLEKKRVTIPLKRVQAIKIVENPFRQLFGYSTVSVESAGSTSGEDSMVIFPLIKKRELEAPLQALFPHYEWQQQFIASPKRAQHFFYRIDFLWVFPLIGALSYFLWPWGALSIALIPLAILFGIWQHRTTAYAITNKQLVLRYRIVSRVTFYVEKHRIQSMTQRATYFKKRKEVQDVTIHVMSGATGATATVKALEEADAQRIATWYHHAKALDRL